MANGNLVLSKGLCDPVAHYGFFILFCRKYLQNIGIFARDTQSNPVYAGKRDFELMLRFMQIRMRSIGVANMSLWETGATWLCGLCLPPGASGGFAALGHARELPSRPIRLTRLRHIPRAAQGRYHRVERMRDAGPEAPGIALTAYPLFFAVFLPYRVPNRKRWHRRSNPCILQPSEATHRNP